MALSIASASIESNENLPSIAPDFDFGRDETDLFEPRLEIAEVLLTTSNPSNFKFDENNCLDLGSLSQGAESAGRSQKRFVQLGDSVAVVPKLWPAEGMTGLTLK
jgi:hypothetical protein|tara:strand:- start:629 stop:943 length:315 start_codon:yes stop_codon:yes gene_type:complete